MRTNDWENTRGYVSIGASASNLRLDDVPVDVADLGALLVGVARLSGVLCATVPDTVSNSDGASFWSAG